MHINPFAPIVTKILATVAVLSVAGLGVQTVRIEGALCRTVKAGEKPACIVQGFKQQLASIRIDLDQVRADRDAERARHQATKQAYADAQAEAARMEQARLARVAAQQKEITDDVVQDYERRIGAARAAAQRLRAQGGAARGGAAGAGGDFAMPDLSDPTGGADGAAGDQQLPGELDRDLIATEQAIRLEQLQGWVRKQSGLRPN